MRLKISLVLVSSLVAILLSVQVPQADSIYAYAIKGIVTDLRLNPTRFIGGWFWKKAFILKKLKIKLKLKKKLILKKLLLKKFLLAKKLFLGVALKSKFGGGIKIFAPKIILPPPPRYFAHGWGPQHFWAHAPLSLFRRKKRAVIFPEDDNRPSQQHQSSPIQVSQNQGSHSHSHSQSQGQAYQFQRHEHQIASLGLSEEELNQLRQLPDNLKQEYGQEMDHIETAASEPKEEEIQDYFSMAKEFDGNSCIPKSICEILARNHTQSPFEKEVLEYYNADFGNTVEKTSPGYIYDYAAHLGRTTRDARRCIQQFSQCPDEPIALNSFMNEVFTPEMCDASQLFQNYEESDGQRNQYLNH